jgi:hypothetical protein
MKRCARCQRKLGETETALCADCVETIQIIKNEAYQHGWDDRDKLCLANCTCKEVKSDMT